MALKDEVLPKFKIPPMRILSDSCAVHVGRTYEDGEVKEEGIAYYVHENEWVEVIPIKTVDELTQMQVMRDELADDLASIAQINHAMANLCEALSHRVVDWNWTDLAGDPLPKPYKNRKALALLHSEEVYWLIDCVTNETVDSRKNGFGGLEDASLETVTSPQK